MRILSPLLPSPPFVLSFGSAIAGFTPPRGYIRRHSQNENIERDSTGKIQRAGIESITRQGGENIERDTFKILEK